MTDVFNTPHIGEPLNQHGAGHAWLRIAPMGLEERSYGPGRSDWRVNLNGRWPWLQRQCFKLLRWLGAEQHDWRTNKVSIVDIEIEPREFIDALFENMENVEEVFGRRPRYLYIGRKQFMQFMRERAYDDPTFTPVNFEAQYGHGKNLVGLRVNVVPWFDGVLFL